jgi:hypothetical protein
MEILLEVRSRLTLELVYWAPNRTVTISPQQVWRRTFDAADGTASRKIPTFSAIR